MPLQVSCRGPFCALLHRAGSRSGGGGLSGGDGHGWTAVEAMQIAWHRSSAFSRDTKKAQGVRKGKNTRKKATTPIAPRPRPKAQSSKARRLVVPVGISKYILSAEGGRPAAPSTTTSSRKDEGLRLRLLHFYFYHFQQQIPITAPRVPFH